MTPRERFDRLFNRIMQAAEQGDSVEVERFTPMALGAYQQLDSRDADARYHAAVLHLQVGDFAAGAGPGGHHPAPSRPASVRLPDSGDRGRFQNIAAALARAERDFLAHYRCGDGGEAGRVSGAQAGDRGVQARGGKAEGGSGRETVARRYAIAPSFRPARLPRFTSI